MRNDVRGSGDIAAIILAAGRSRRMPGGSKLLCRFGGELVVRVVARVAAASGLRPVVACVPDASDPVARALEGLPVDTVSVPAGKQSPIVSAAAGLSTVRETGVSAAMVLLADEPGLTSGDIDTVRRAWIAGTGDLLRADYRDRPGHPVLVARCLFDRVIDLARTAEPEMGMWERLTQTGFEGVEVSVDREAPIDVDSPAALQAARSRARR